jgi:2'-5' RNA ligase
LEAAEAVLARFAQNSGSFRVSTSGLGVFTGPRPVLYFPLVRSAALARLHRELWLAVDKIAQGALAYYHPENWIPHITLAQEKLDQRTLSEILGWLCGQDFTWEFPVNNLSLIHDSGGKQELHCCFGW